MNAGKGFKAYQVKYAFVRVRYSLQVTNGAARNLSPLSVRACTIGCRGESALSSSEFWNGLCITVAPGRGSYTDAESTIINSGLNRAAAATAPAFLPTTAFFVREDADNTAPTAMPPVLRHLIARVIL